MSDRIAQCESCQSRYKIPDSFTGNRAKCKKCGAIMVVPAAGEEAASSASTQAKATPPPAPRSPAKPAAARGPSSARKQVAASRGARSATRASGRAAGRSTGRSGRRDHSESRARRGTASKSIDPKLLIGIAAGAIVVVVLVVLVLKGGGEGDQQEAAKAASNTPAPEAAPEQPQAEPETQPAEVPDLVPADTKPAEQPEAPAPKPQPKPEEPEELNPVIAFAAHDCQLFPKTPDTTDEEWQDIEKLVHTAMTDRGAKGTRAGRRLTKTYAFKAIPALINSYDGMDLSDPMVRVNAQYVSRLLEETFHEVVKVGFKAGDSEKDLRYNIKLINSFIPYWKKRVEDPDAMAKTKDLIDEAAAKEEDQ